MIQRDSMSIDYLRECFDLLDDGTLRWRERPPHHFKSPSRMAAFNSQCAGKLAGCMGATGYWCVKITAHGRSYKCLAHRIVWALAHGAPAPKIIDHINGKRHDNRPENLRAADLFLNAQNRRGWSAKLNGSPLGVTYIQKTNKWQSAIGSNGRSFYLGMYSTPEEAHEAYRAAKQKLHQVQPW